MAIVVIPSTGAPYSVNDFKGEPPLSWMKQTVGGYIEAVFSRYDGRPNHRPHQMIIDEEGKLKHKDLNLRATLFALRLHMIHGDVIVGPAIVLSGKHIMR